MFLLKFQVGELVGCGIQFQIQRVPTLYTFDRPLYPKNKKYLKKCDDDVIITFFQVFIVFGVERYVKSCSVGIRWMRNQIMHPTSSPDQNFSNTGRYVKNTNRKSSFFLFSSKINKYYFIILLFSYEAHFRPQNSSNDFHCSPIQLNNLGCGWFSMTIYLLAN